MYEFLTSPLFWLLLGITCILIEFTHYGFIFFFFGLGAFLTAILTWAGLSNSLTLQLIIFTAGSLIFLFLLRKKMSDVFKGRITGKMPGLNLDNVIGAKVVVVSAIQPGKLNGKVEFHGTLWEAQSDEEIEKDTIVEIIEKNNLTLKVKPVSKQ